jgi:low affinity Fe/Cu permease
MDTHPVFTLVVVGTVTDSAAVAAKLEEHLRRKLRTHRVTILAGRSASPPRFSICGTI